MNKGKYSIICFVAVLFFSHLAFGFFGKKEKEFDPLLAMLEIMLDEANQEHDKKIQEQVKDHYLNKNEIYYYSDWNLTHQVLHKFGSSINYVEVNKSTGLTDEDKEAFVDFLTSRQSTDDPPVAQIDKHKFFDVEFYTQSDQKITCNLLVLKRKRNWRWSLVNCNFESKASTDTEQGALMVFTIDKDGSVKKVSLSITDRERNYMFSDHMAFSLAPQRPVDKDNKLRVLYEPYSLEFEENQFKIINPMMILEMDVLVPGHTKATRVTKVDQLINASTELADFLCKQNDPSAKLVKIESSPVEESYYKDGNKVLQFWNVEKDTMDKKALEIGWGPYVKYNYNQKSKEYTSAIVCSNK